MKKMIKLSLVAAVAVAGLTTTASAANLADAVKNTQLNGYVRYRLHTDHENSGSAVEETKAVMKFTTKVNAAVKANVKIVAVADTGKDQTAAAMNVTEGNFVISLGKSTLIAGLQTSQSPFFANNGDTRSHGLTALIPAGGMTIAAAHYTTTTVPVLTNEVTALGLIGKAGSVGFQAWHAVVSNSGSVALNDAAATNLSLSTKVGSVNVDAMYSTLTLDGTTDTGITKVVASGKAGNVSYVAGYAVSEKDGGRVAVDNDDDAVSDLAMYSLAMSATKDASAILVGASMPVSKTTTVAVNHLSGSDDMSTGTAKDFSETDVKVSYKMSKNFGAAFTYAMADAMGTDLTNSRIEVKYTF